MRKNKLFYILFVSLIFSDCQESKYKMPTMTGGKDVDVTSLIETKKYYPVFCDNKLIKLKKSTPDKISNKVKNEFNKEVITLPEKFQNIVYNFEYQYSYIIFDEPVDVYVASSKYNLDKIYFRVDNSGEYIKDIKLDEGWVTSSCD